MSLELLAPVFAIGGGAIGPTFQPADETLLLFDFTGVIEQTSEGWSDPFAVPSGVTDGSVMAYNPVADTLVAFVTATGRNHYQIVNGVWDDGNTLGVIPVTFPRAATYDNAGNLYVAGLRGSTPEVWRRTAAGVWARYATGRFSGDIYAMTWDRRTTQNYLVGLFSQVSGGITRYTMARFRSGSWSTFISLFRGAHPILNDMACRNDGHFIGIQSNRTLMRFNPRTRRWVNFGTAPTGNWTGIDYAR